MESDSLQTELLLNEDREENETAPDEVFALAFFRTTPRIAVYLISFFIAVAHILFVLGQVSVMWFLGFGVDYSGTFHASTLETKLLFDALKLENPVAVNTSFNYHAANFTYGDAVNKLWLAEGLNSTVGPRTCAMVLIIFSGIWPHLKLIMLHYFWLFPSKPSTRTSALYWLSTFGKWSLCDVIVVCVLIGVVNLDIQLDSQFVLHQLQLEVPRIVAALERAVSKSEAGKEICEAILKYKSGTLIHFACLEVVYELYDHPKLIDSAVESVFKGIEAKGGGVASLRIAGLFGIYLFSIAVIISLIVGLIVDTYDHHAKSSIKHDRRPSAADPLQSNFLILYDKLPNNLLSKRRYMALAAFAVFSLAMGILGVLLPSMERDVPGAIPNIIDETLGVGFTKQYSVYSLGRTTGAAGGADYFLLSVFMLFCVAGPLLRSFIALVQLLMPASKAWHTQQLFVVNILGVFSGWDVLFLALYLVNLEMPPITNTLIDPNGEICHILKSFGYASTCLEIEYGVVWPGFLFVMFAFASHMVVCSFVTKLGFYGLDPYHDGDTGGPYCPESCGQVLRSPSKTNANT